MMQQVLFNPNAFAHPVTGIMLGFINFVIFVFIEFINLVNILYKPDFDTILARFVSYSLLIQISQLYMKQKRKYAIKFDCDDFFLTIYEEESQKNNSEIMNNSML